MGNWRVFAEKININKLNKQNKMLVGIVGSVYSDLNATEEKKIACIVNQC